jgi:hypothetical protein
MENHPFSTDDVEELGKKILSELFSITEGDEWQSVLVKDIFTTNNIGLKEEYYKNEHYRNSALQYLVADGYIITDESHKTINITHRGKHYINMIGSRK